MFFFYRSLFFLFLISSLIFSKESFLLNRKKTHHNPIICGWYSENSNASIPEIEGDLKFYHKEGVDCVNYMADIPKYKRAVKIAKKIGLKIYAWIPALIGLGNNKKWIYDNHPEVFMRTKSGVDSYKTPIFGAKHYKLLCPNNPIVRDFLKNMYNNVSKISGLDGVNIDYIRYVEKSLKRKYNPKGDTCYCDYCVSSFYNKTGINVTAVKQPDKLESWNNFRINVITSLVNEISDIVHSNGIKFTADVYPGPIESTNKTKQKWDDWNLDMVFPMIYTKVFRKPLSWVKEKILEARNARNAKGKLYIGLEGERMNDKDFRKAVNLAVDNGADGISIFKLNNINMGKFRIAKKEKPKFLDKKLRKHKLSNK